MKKAVLIHNPTAGDGNHEKEDLEKMIDRAGFEVKYFSTDSLFWKHFIREDADIIFVAGGDGTVQKLVGAMLDAKEEGILQVPIQVLAFGTANNIATTFKIQDPKQQIQQEQKKIGVDIGTVKGAEEASFFIEGLGCGIFPKLVSVMEVKEEGEKQDEIKQSLKELLKLIDTYEAREAIIIADKEEITGKFLLIELMNIRFIGPNIEIAPHAETGDGNFELVLVRENFREDLKAYIRDLLNEKTSSNSIEEFAELKTVSDVRLKWKGTDVHIDDEILKNYQGEELVIKNRQAVFQFLISQ